jgi:hypothetical protein
MTLRGRVENGSIVFDQDVRLPEGAEVRVEVLEDGSARDGINGPSAPGASLFDRQEHVIGSVEGFASDFAASHDHYIHGTPRR